MSKSPTLVTSTIQKLFLGVFALSIASTVIYAIFDYVSRSSAQIHGGWSYFSPLLLNMIIPVFIATGLWLLRTKRELNVETLFVVILGAFMIQMLFQSLMTITTAVASLAENSYVPADGELMAIITIAMSFIFVMYLRSKKQW